MASALHALNGARQAAPGEERPPGTALMPTRTWQTVPHTTVDRAGRGRVYRGRTVEQVRRRRAARRAVRGTLHLVVILLYLAAIVVVGVKIGVAVARWT